ncbi:VWA domain-containing protein [Desulforhopalus vacuolatus]|uniref:VWA domain-containing protein n=1 Tax=Desulforhopalus vacuolatus TaxID=40414 RepID=UPI001966CC6F|nr:VWA domain-containing protein [Desulforhopalus vacuolatus]MBM9519410.1 VWA domain-containing protein [Desulforhopalus vacuolatus]
MNIQFAHPVWLTVGLAASLLLAEALYLAEKRRRRAMQQFASPELAAHLTRNISRRRRLWKGLLLVLTLFLCFTALARPQYGYHWEEVKRRGIDLLFALDTSRSMQAEDVKPNRLARAKMGIYDFVNQLEGDRVGLLPFAGSSYLMCPLTLDYNAFNQSLESIDTKIIPRGGTSLSEVINSATNILGQKSSHKILIILTDGENLEGDAIAAAEQAAKAGVTIYTVGVGTRSGELIPLANGKGVIRDASGNPVRSQLDAKTLIKIAETTGGIYAPLGKAGEGLEKIYKSKLSLVPQEELSGRRHKVLKEQFQWPLAGAILLLLVEFLINDRRREKTVTASSIAGLAKRHRGSAGALVLAILLAFPVSSRASEADIAYNKGDYSTATRLYAKQLDKQPEDAQRQFNLGVASCKNKQYDEAIDAFSKTLKSDDLSLQQKAYFNRGNAFYSKGEKRVQKQPGEAIKEWQQAVDSFQAAVNLNPQDTAAQENLQYVQKELKKLKEQQKQDKKQKKDQQQKKQDKKKNNPQQQQQQQQQQNAAGSNNQEKSGEKEQNNVKSKSNNKTEKDPKDNTDKMKDSQSDKAQSQPQKSPGADSVQQNKKEQQTQSGEKNNSQPAGAREISGTGENQKSSESAVAPPGNQSAALAAEQQAQAASAEAKKRRTAGKMTHKEALLMLNTMKGDSDSLRFIPAPPADKPETQKDW